LVFRSKKQKCCQPHELIIGDCWIGMTQASKSGLIIATRVGKHTDEFISQLIVNTEGKTDCHQWYTDSWGGYERVLEREVNHVIGKEQTQQLERTNGIIRQQTGRWHRRQNKFAKVREQTKATVRLVVSYFNWIWVHSRQKNTAAMRADLAIAPWSWHQLITYPTLV
jgi:insertion element IS1 protein InsB